MNSTKNQQIIHGIIAGDSLILKEFYKKNLLYVRKYILRNGGITEDVDDIFQDSLVLIYHKLRNGSLQIDVSIHSFFMGVCKNKWRNQLRKQSKVCYDDHLVAQKLDTRESVIDTMAKEDQTTLYQKHFTTLTDSSKHVLSLFFEGISMRDIANITGYTEGYVRKKKCKVKEHLLHMVQNDPVYMELVVH